MTDVGRPLLIGVIVTSTVDGGGESYLRDLYRGLRHNGSVTPTLIGFIPRWAPEHGLNLRPIRTPPKLTSKRNRALQAYETFRLVLSLQRHAQKHSFDLFHLQYKREQLFLTRVLARRAPVVWTEHGPLPGLPPWALSLYRWQSKKATVIAVSQGVAHELLGHGIPSTVIPNYVPQLIPKDDNSLLRINRAALHLSNEDKVVVYLGRLHVAKRVDLLIEAARYLPVKWKVVIAGTGPDAERLRAFAASISNVTFVGHVPASSVLAIADCLVLTSGADAREGSPIAMLEAVGAGVPIVVMKDSHAAEEAASLGGTVVEPVASLVATAVDESFAHMPYVGGDARTYSSWLQAHAFLYESLTI